MNLQEMLFPRAPGAAGAVLPIPTGLSLPVPRMPDLKSEKEPAERSKTPAERLQKSVAELKRIEESLPDEARQTKEPIVPIDEPRRERQTRSYRRPRAFFD